MSSRLGESAIIAAGLGYLLALAWAMPNLSYDIWGALVLVPIYGVLGVAGLRRMFRGDLAPVATVMCWGLLLKLGGAFARYWVGFEAYDGGIDAGEYHRIATEKAGAIWAGDLPAFEAVPTGTGTIFVENFTGFVYTLTGGSQLAGFVTFSFLAFWGLAFMVKAAAVAIPDMAIRKYAWLCVTFPSIVYWPSSIGKEALMMFGLGIGTCGIAVMLAQHRWMAPLVVIGLGLGFAAVIRPHMAGIWVAATLPALLLAAVVGGRRTRTGHRRSRLGVIPVVAIASVCLAVLASATVQFLQPPPHADSFDDSGSITAIFEETARRTSQAGSQFTPPSVSSPLNWPYAVARTLTRPLPMEARGIAQLVSAAEMSALFLLYAVSWKRIRNLPYALIRNPYVVFVMLTLFLSALAFSVFANLGLLARQRSLVVPFLVLVPCLPVTIERLRRPGRLDTAQISTVGDQNTSMSPSVNARLDTGGRPKSLAARTPRTNRPVGNDTNLDELWA